MGKKEKNDVWRLYMEITDWSERKTFQCLEVSFDGFNVKSQY